MFSYKRHVRRRSIFGLNLRRNAQHVEGSSTLVNMPKVKYRDSVKSVIELENRNGESELLVSGQNLIIVRQQRLLLQFKPGMKPRQILLHDTRNDHHLGIEWALIGAATMQALLGSVTTQKHSMSPDSVVTQKDSMSLDNVITQKGSTNPDSVITQKHSMSLDLERQVKDMDAIMRPGEGISTCVVPNCRRALLMNKISDSIDIVNGPTDEKHLLLVKRMSQNSHFFQPSHVYKHSYDGSVKSHEKEDSKEGLQSHRVCHEDTKLVRLTKWCQLHHNIRIQNTCIFAAVFVRTAS
jgi:hypothetical protein